MGGYDKDLVMVEEVEANVRWLMEWKRERKLRERMVAAKESAVAALREGVMSLGIDGYR